MAKRSIADEMTEGPLAVMGIVGGVLLVLWGLVMLPENVGFLRVAESADGVVTEDLGHNRMWIDFTTADGQEYGLRAFVEDGRVGDHVEVLYRPDRPTPEPRLNAPDDLMRAQFYGFGIGLPILFMSVWRLRVKLRRDRAQARAATGAAPPR